MEFLAPLIINRMIKLHICKILFGQSLVLRKVAQIIEITNQAQENMTELIVVTLILVIPCLTYWGQAQSVEIRN